jgi:hypothetical protein
VTNETCQPRTNEPTTSNPPRYRYAYTVCLFIIAGLAAMMVFSHQMMIGMFRQDPAADILIPVLRFVQSVEVILCLACLAVAVLRSKNSPLARPMTAAVSIFLAIWLPFGTAMFIWWLARVRRQERPVPSEARPPSASEI